MDESAIRKTIVDWLKVVYPTVNSVVTEIIRADQIGGKPIYPFVTYRLDSFVQLGHDEILPVDEDGIQTISGQRYCTVSIHYYGDNHMGNINKAFISLEKITTRDFFAEANIAICSRDTIQNVSSMLESIFEQHATFDFFIEYCDTDTDDVGLIEKVELEQDYTTDGGTIVKIGTKDYEV